MRCCEASAIVWLVIAGTATASLASGGAGAGDASTNAMLVVGDDGALHIDLDDNKPVFVNGVDVLGKLDTLAAQVQALAAENAVLAATINPYPTLVAANAPGLDITVDVDDIAMSNKGLTTFSFGTVPFWIRGDINLNSNSDLTLIDFGRITSVGGHIDLRFTPALTSIAFANIRFIGGDVSLVESGLSHIDFGALTYLAGSISFAENHALTVLDFGNVQSIKGSIACENNALTSISFGNLTHVRGSISLQQTAITALDFGRLQRVGPVTFAGNPATEHFLTEVHFRGLKQVGPLSLHDNHLTSIDFAQITKAGNINLRQNKLTRISFGALREVENVDVGVNLLWLCEVVYCAGTNKTINKQ